MEEFDLKINDYVLVKAYPLGDSFDLVGKVITIRKKIITDVDIVILAKYPTELYNECFPLKQKNTYKKRIQVLGKSKLLLELYK